MRKTSGAQNIYEEGHRRIIEFVYDEQENVWVYTIEMPEEERQAPDHFGVERNITINNLVSSLF